MSHLISHRAKFVSRASERSLLKDFAVRLVRVENFGHFFDVGHMVTEVVLEVREKASSVTNLLTLTETKRKTPDSVTHPIHTVEGNIALA